MPDQVYNRSMVDNRIIVTLYRTLAPQPTKPDIIQSQMGQKKNNKAKEVKELPLWKKAADTLHLFRSPNLLSNCAPGKHSPEYPYQQIKQILHDMAPLEIEGRSPLVYKNAVNNVLPKQSQSAYWRRQRNFIMNCLIKMRVHNDLDFKQTLYRLASDFQFVEDTADPVWGRGPDYNGMNLLGTILGSTAKLGVSLPLAYAQFVNAFTAPYGAAVINTEGDGNCCFHTMAWLLNNVGYDVTHEELRNEASSVKYTAEELEDMPYGYSYTNPPLNTGPASYADHEYVQAICLKYDVAVYLVCYFQDVTELVWCGRPNSPIVGAVYLNGPHYTPIMPYPFPAAGDVALSDACLVAAVLVATEHQYKNIKHSPNLCVRNARYDYKAAREAVDATVAEHIKLDAPPADDSLMEKLKHGVLQFTPTSVLSQDAIAKAKKVQATLAATTVPTTAPTTTVAATTAVDTTVVTTTAAADAVAVPTSSTAVTTATTTAAGIATPTSVAATTAATTVVTSTTTIMSTKVSTKTAVDIPALDEFDVDVDVQRSSSLSDLHVPVEIRPRSLSVPDVARPLAPFDVATPSPAIPDVTPAQPVPAPAPAPEPVPKAIQFDVVVHGQKYPWITPSADTFASLAKAFYTVNKDCMCENISYCWTCNGNKVDPAATLASVYPFKTLDLQVLFSRKKHGQFSLDAFSSPTKETKFDPETEVDPAVMIETILKGSDSTAAKGQQAYTLAGLFMNMAADKAVGTAANWFKSNHGPLFSIVLAIVTIIYNLCNSRDWFIFGTQIGIIVASVTQMIATSKVRDTHRKSTEVFNTVLRHAAMGNVQSQSAAGIGSTIARLGTAVCGIALACSGCMKSVSGIASVAGAANGVGSFVDTMWTKCAEMMGYTDEITKGLREQLDYLAREADDLNAACSTDFVGAKLGKAKDLQQNIDAFIGSNAVKTAGLNTVPLASKAATLAGKVCHARRQLTSSKQRPNPVAIWIYGDPGHGKTHFVERTLPQYLHAVFGAEFNTDTFTTQDSAKHFDHYNGQSTWIVNEVGAKTADKGTSLFVQNFNDAISTTPIHLPTAALDGKAQRLTGVRLIAATSNYSVEQAGISGDAAFLDAFKSRITVAKLVDRHKNSKARNFTHNKHRRPDGAHLTFELADGGMQTGLEFLANIANQIAESDAEFARLAAPPEFHVPKQMKLTPMTDFFSDDFKNTLENPKQARSEAGLGGKVYWPMWVYGAANANKTLTGARTITSQFAAGGYSVLNVEVAGYWPIDVEPRTLVVMDDPPPPTSRENVEKLFHWVNSLPTETPVLFISNYGPPEDARKWFSLKNWRAREYIPVPDMEQHFAKRLGWDPTSNGGSYYCAKGTGLEDRKGNSISGYEPYYDYIKFLGEDKIKQLEEMPVTMPFSSDEADLFMTDFSEEFTLIETLTHVANNISAHAAMAFRENVLHSASKFTGDVDATIVDVIARTLRQHNDLRCFYQSQTVTIYINGNEFCVNSYEGLNPLVCETADDGSEQHYVVIPRPPALWKGDDDVTTVMMPLDRDQLTAVLDNQPWTEIPTTWKRGYGTRYEQDNCCSATVTKAMQTVFFNTLHRIKNTDSKSWDKLATAFSVIPEKNLKRRIMDAVLKCKEALKNTSTLYWALGAIIGLLGSIMVFQLWSYYTPPKFPRSSLEQLADIMKQGHNKSCVYSSPDFCDRYVKVQAELVDGMCECESQAGRAGRSYSSYANNQHGTHNSKKRSGIETSDQDKHDINKVEDRTKLQKTNVEDLSPQAAQALTSIARRFVNNKPSLKEKYMNGIPFETPVLDHYGKAFSYHFNGRDDDIDNYDDNYAYSEGANLSRIQAVLQNQKRVTDHAGNPLGFATFMFQSLCRVPLHFFAEERVPVVHHLGCQYLLKLVRQYASQDIGWAVPMKDGKVVALDGVKRSTLRIPSNNEAKEMAGRFILVLQKGPAFNTHEFTGRFCSVGGLEGTIRTETTSFDESYYTLDPASNNFLSAPRTGPGDCGNLVLKEVGNDLYWVGNHIAGAITGAKAYAAGVTLEELDDVGRITQSHAPLPNHCDDLKPVSIPALNNLKDSPAQPTELLMPGEMLDRINLFPGDSETRYTPVGPGLGPTHGFASHIPVDTRQTKELLDGGFLLPHFKITKVPVLTRKEIEDHHAHRIPADAKGKKQAYNIRLHKANANVAGQIDKGIVERGLKMARDYGEHFGGRCGRKAHPLDINTAIWGDAAVGIEPIPMAKSSGAFLQTLFKGKSKKRDFLGDHGIFTGAHGAYVEWLIASQRREGKRRRTILLPSSVHLKSENLPEEKNWKKRLVHGLDIASVVNQRSLLLPIQYKMAKLKDTPVAVSFDACTWFPVLADNLKQHPNKCMFDISSFDLTVRWELMRMAAEFCKGFYGANPALSNWLDSMVDGVAWAPLLLDDNLVYKQGGVCSGMGCTSFFDGVVVFLALRLAIFEKLGHDAMRVDVLEKEIYTTSCGDDTVGCWSDFLEEQGITAEYFTEFAAKVGLTLTGMDKTVEGAAELTDVDGLEFVSRTITRLKYAHHIQTGALKLISIASAMCYTNAPDDAGIKVEALAGGARELAMWGDVELFNAVKADILQRYPTCDIPTMRDIHKDVARQVKDTVQGYVSLSSEHIERQVRINLAKQVLHERLLNNRLDANYINLVTARSMNPSRAAKRIADACKGIDIKASEVNGYLSKDPAYDVLKRAAAMPWVEFDVGFQLKFPQLRSPELIRCLVTEDAEFEKAVQTVLKTPNEGLSPNRAKRLVMLKDVADVFDRALNGHLDDVFRYWYNLDEPEARSETSSLCYTDLLAVPEREAIAHCVAVDGCMGAGVAEQITRRWPLVRPHFLQQKPKIGDCVVTEDPRIVFNLVTKQYSDHKPILRDYEYALQAWFCLMHEMGVTLVHIPRMGAGLDMLDWKDCEHAMKKHNIHAVTIIVHDFTPGVTGLLERQCVATPPCIIKKLVKLLPEEDVSTGIDVGAGAGALRPLLGGATATAYELNETHHPVLEKLYDTVHGGITEKTPLDTVDLSVINPPFGLPKKHDPSGEMRMARNLMLQHAVNSATWTVGVLARTDYAGLQKHYRHVTVEKEEFTDFPLKREQAYHAEDEKPYPVVLFRWYNPEVDMKNTLDAHQDALNTRPRTARLRQAKERVLKETAARAATLVHFMRQHRIPLSPEMQITLMDANIAVSQAGEDHPRPPAPPTSGDMPADGMNHAPAEMGSAVAVQPVAPIMSSTDVGPTVLDSGAGMMGEGLLQSGYLGDASSMAGKNIYVETINLNTTTPSGTVLRVIDFDPWDPSLIGKGTVFADLHEAFMGFLRVNLSLESSSSTGGKLRMYAIPAMFSRNNWGTSASLTELDIACSAKIDLAMSGPGSASIVFNPTVDQVTDPNIKSVITRTKLREGAKYGQIVIVCYTAIYNAYGSEIPIPLIRSAYLNDGAKYMWPVDMVQNGRVTTDAPKLDVEGFFVYTDGGQDSNYKFDDVKVNINQVATGRGYEAYQLRGFDYQSRPNFASGHHPDVVSGNIEQAARDSGYQPNYPIMDIGQDYDLATYEGLSVTNGTIYMQTATQEYLVDSTTRAKIYTIDGVTYGDVPLPQQIYQLCFEVSTEPKAGTPPAGSTFPNEEVSFEGVPICKGGFAQTRANPTGFSTVNIEDVKTFVPAVDRSVRSTTMPKSPMWFKNHVETKKWLEATGNASLVDAVVDSNGAYLATILRNAEGIYMATPISNQDSHYAGQVMDQVSMSTVVYRNESWPTIQETNWAYATRRVNDFANARLFGKDVSELCAEEPKTNAGKACKQMNDLMDKLQNLPALKAALNPGKPGATVQSQSAIVKGIGAGLGAAADMKNQNKMQDKNLDNAVKLSQMQQDTARAMQQANFDQQTQMQSSQFEQQGMMANMNADLQRRNQLASADNSLRNARVLQDNEWSHRNAFAGSRTPGANIPGRNPATARTAADVVPEMAMML